MLKKKEDFIIQNKKSGIYVHFPFCAFKCGFCDFYSGVMPYNGEYFKNIISEIELYTQNGLNYKEYHFDTLYLGGGTPSLSSIKDLELFFEYLQTQGLLKQLQEISIELNPEDVTQELLDFYKYIGINRISLGVQSLDQKTLTLLERRATIKKTLESILLVRNSFSNYSLDFMFGIPDQDLCTELFSFSSFAPPHISTYALTLYPGTPFYIKKNYFEKTDESFLQNYEDIHNFFEQLGYEHYEISNFAKSGYQSLHNKHYWLQDYYLGLGAGASGYLKDYRYTNYYLKDYISSLQQSQYPIKEREEINQQSFMVDTFLLKLRQSQEFSIMNQLGFFEQEIQKELNDYFVEIAKKGYIYYDESEKILRANYQTWVFSDSISKQIYNILY